MMLERGLVVERARVEPFSPRPLKRLVHRNPVEPGERGRAAPEAVEMTPRLDEGVLRRLVDVALVVQYAPEDGTDAPLEEAHELGERVEISLLRTLEQLGLVLRHATTL